ELGPHILRHAQPFLLEFFLRVDDAAYLADDVLDTGLGLVPEELRILMRDMAVVAAGGDAGAIHAMTALPPLRRDPLHRVACAAAELVGAGDLDHHLGSDDGGGADDDADDQQRKYGPPGAR